MVVMSARLEMHTTVGCALEAKARVSHNDPPRAFSWAIYAQDEFRHILRKRNLGPGWGALIVEPLWNLALRHIARRSVNCCCLSLACGGGCRQAGDRFSSVSEGVGGRVAPVCRSPHSLLGPWFPRPPRLSLLCPVCPVT